MDLETFPEESSGHEDPYSFKDSEALQLGLTLQALLKDTDKAADFPIEEPLKETINRLILANLAAFETAFKTGSLQLEPSHSLHIKFTQLLATLTQLTQSKTITYRQLIDAHLRLVDASEEILFKDKSAYELGYSFKPLKTHDERVTHICVQFPAICQIPLQRPKGLFSYHLLARQFDTFRLINNQPHIVWPFVIDPSCRTVHTMKAAPSGLGRHDRIHLAVFLNAINASKGDLADPTFANHQAFFIDLERNVKTCVKNFYELRKKTWHQKTPHQKQAFDFIQYFTLHENLTSFQEFPIAEERIERLTPLILSRLPFATNVTKASFETEIQEILNQAFSNELN
jgi:hypothetical protein